MSWLDSLWDGLGTTGNAATRSAVGKGMVSVDTTTSVPHDQQKQQQQQQKPQQEHVPLLPPIQLPKGRELSAQMSVMSAESGKECGADDGKSQRARCRLPKIDQGRRPKKQQLALCRQWILSHRDEQARARAVVDVARELFYNVMVRCNSSIVEDGYDQMQLLALKTAASCFLLEEIVKALPRHGILRPCVGFLLRAVYVPDTPEMRDALGGTLAYPFILQNFPLEPATRTLLARYARKTYFIAHHELTQKVIVHAHTNVSRLQHFKRLPRVFALMSVNWVKFLLRIILRAWRHLCLVRRQNEQKHRARWARRFAAERIRFGVQRWRVYANIRLQGAEAGEVMKARIEALKMSTRSLENEINALSEESARLSAEIESKAELHVLFGKRISEIEQEYKNTLECVREMDRVGSRLLDSLLLKTPFPAEAETLSPLELLVLWANTTLLESPLGPLFLSSTDEDFAHAIDKIASKQTNKQQINVSEVAEEDLPFNPLLTETPMVNLPMHCFLALIRAMDYDAGPGKEDLKMVCTSEMRIRSLRSKMENNAEAVDLKDPETAAILESEVVVGHTIVEAYEALTGGTCIVTGAQLMTRKRGIQLLFLAALMRHFSNWMENQVRKQRSVEDKRPSLATAPTLTTVEVDLLGAPKKEEEEEEAPTVDSHLGVRDRKYFEWYHPPQNHVEWIARVQNQRQWIAASLSALHEALNVALEPSTLVPMEVQGDSPEFLENVTLKRLSDILPKKAITSGTFFLRLARVVENALPKLRALFLQYSLEDRTADGGGDVSSGSNSSTIGSRYITSIGFWNLLRDCRVVGGPGKINRAILRQILGNVFGTSVAAAANGRVREGNNLPRARRRILSALLSPVSDVRGSQYRLRFNAAEFIEILLRCAQAWDSLRHRQIENELKTFCKKKNSAVDTNTASLASLPGQGSDVLTDAEADDTVEDAKGEKKEIRYEACDMTWALRPAAVREFFHEWIVSHGFRGPTLDPFHRALRHPALREHIMANIDILLSLFTIYTTPKEAYGMPTKIPDMETSMRRLVLDKPENSIQQKERDSFLASATTTVQSGNPGIVRVMTVRDVKRMAKDFDWLSIRRVTSSVIEDAFFAICPDTENEFGLIFFTEWLDLLCVIAQYHNPDPTVPLHEKVPPFFKEHVTRYHRGDH
ncbi:hypothetical protein C3747_168g64 [Trypanosoma cruzi]|uniref:Uncharacterized protein n=2 Tax=Trypanosoma cruzi TaxID=5693 RepID=Q4DVD4_TRYCC|nr:hypothetical protein, conserved [Trypanosoma cruzi]EAN96476.1 hypothetical protein, conserved [Trypanosoma cruzi]PWV03835.1 hypothetical protein C3747_168g64 [Trypanosoma cruzi]RNC61939.1 hypothetical protein TcCL_ESM00328 [Trypanosoma cruzi]|eukprot:XP_818327.1 hypothetical protein [Trypanosoma cruzi strain CL Brener]